MNSTETSAVSQFPAAGSASANRARLFYTGAAIVLLVVMALGFQQFYLHGRAYPGRPLTPPIRTLLIAHGTVMTAWMLLFLAQPLLIVSNNRRVHMVLGRVGAVLAAGVVVLGLRVGIEAARVNPPELKLWGLGPHEFLAVPLIAVLLFAAFVIVGVWNRRRSQVHRPMMLLAVLAVIPAAFDRVTFIHNLYSGTVWGTIFGPFFSTLVLGLVFLVAKWLVTRSWDQWYARGFAVMILASALTMQLAPTRAWEHVSSFLLR